MSIPVLFTVYAEFKRPIFAPNLELGMAFFFTWFLTAIILIFGVLFRFREKEDDIYLL
jgi:hypothetical protein